MSGRPSPPRLLLAWEGLHVGVQVAIALPVAVALLWAAHVWLLNQPLGRGLGYAVFWGALATGAIVGASRAERARRLHGDGPGGSDGAGRPPAGRGPGG
jgi:hypothetical protein